MLDFSDELSDTYDASAATNWDVANGVDEMTWKTLAEALNGATAKGFDIGEMAAATASQPTEFGEPTDHEWTAGPCRAVTNSQMGAAINQKPSPAAEGRPVLRNGKREPAHDPTSAPPLGAGSRLLFRVIEGGGGRLEEGGPCVRRLRRNSWRDRARELGWVVHSAASR